MTLFVTTFMAFGALAAIILAALAVRDYRDGNTASAIAWGIIAAGGLLAPLALVNL